MSYLATARKYRPQTFEELVGQEHIAKTLQNAVKNGKVSHAYLFSGIRGVGKTSAARILAKAMNCEHGPTPNPCNKCRYCKEINEGISLDLVEIDGASNRKIDEIRELRKNIRFVPSSARYKVYIIDEVHMLTNEAFNALLKTLEEPPEHVIFILATTEPHKVPSTIRSRCQQFVFKMIPTTLIVQTLKRILEDLKIDYEENALFWIAKNATGSMRDAESMLDQVISYSEGRITLNDVFDVLGLPRYELYHRFVRAIGNGDYEECLKILDILLRQGIEIELIISGIIEYFRNMYLLKLNNEGMDVIVDLPDDDKEIMKELSRYFTSRDIGNLLTLLSKLYTDTRNSEIARYLFEITLIKMIHYKEIIHPFEILRRLEALEKRLNGENVGGDNAFNNNVDFTSNVIADVTKSKKESNANFITEIKRNSNEKGEILERIIKALRFKRRAIAEFLDKASRCSYEGDKIKIYFNKDQKLGFDHLNEKNTKRLLKEEIEDIMGKSIELIFILEDDKGDEIKVEELSPEIEKVLQIFKGEIISNKEDGGS